MKRLILKFRRHPHDPREGAHRTVQVFAALADSDLDVDVVTVGNCGDIVMRDEEWEALEAVLNDTGESTFYKKWAKPESRTGPGLALKLARP